MVLAVRAETIVIVHRDMFSYFGITLTSTILQSLTAEPSRLFFCCEHLASSSGSTCLRDDSKSPASGVTNQAQVRTRSTLIRWFGVLAPAVLWRMKRALPTSLASVLAIVGFVLTSQCAVHTFLRLPHMTLGSAAYPKVAQDLRTSFLTSSPQA